MATHEDVGAGFDPGATGHELQGRASAPRVDSASDDRTANNAVRHQYRVLTAVEKAQMVQIKDAGATLLGLIEALRQQDGRLATTEHGDVVPDAVHPSTRMLDIAAERAEEAVMWAVKHITA